MAKPTVDGHFRIFALYEDLSEGYNCLMKDFEPIVKPINVEK
ncbi:MAG: hypothetical protein ACFFC7_22540 [Candidatus Hermodarchaeota archaeon]